MRIDKCEKALMEIDKLLSKKPQNGYYLYLRASCLNDLNRYNEALVEIKNALNEGYSIENCNSIMGIIYWNKGNYSEAKKCFEEVLRLNSNNALALARSGYMQHKLNSKIDCEQIMEDAYRLAPTNTKVLHVVFNYYKDKKDNKKLKEILEKYLEHSDNEFDKLVKLGDYEFSIKKYKKAKEYYKQAFLLDPNKKYLHKKITLIDLRYFTLGLPANKVGKVLRYLFLGLFIITMIYAIVDSNFHFNNIIDADIVFKILYMLVGLFIILGYLLRFYVSIYNKIYKFVMKRRGLDE